MPRPSCSPPTIWMLRVLPGWRGSLGSSKAQWWQSHTTGGTRVQLAGGAPGDVMRSDRSGDDTPEVHSTSYCCNLPVPCTPCTSRCTEMHRSPLQPSPPKSHMLQQEHAQQFVRLCVLARLLGSTLLYVNMAAASPAANFMSRAGISLTMWQAGSLNWTGELAFPLRATTVSG